jgi:hypothetical protein
MKAFIKAMIWRLISIPFQRAVHWTSEDAKAFDVFTRTLAGQKLFELLRQTVATNTFQAVYQDRVSANARARGMQDLLAVLHRLRSFPPEAESEYSGDEDIEPLPSQRAPLDGRKFNLSGGNTAIRNSRQ